MKHFEMNSSLEQMGVMELSKVESSNSNGGFLLALGAAVTVYGALFAVAYGAGALYAIVEDHS